MGTVSLLIGKPGWTIEGLHNWSPNMAGYPETDFLFKALLRDRKKRQIKSFPRGRALYQYSLIDLMLNISLVL